MSDTVVTHETALAPLAAEVREEAPVTWRSAVLIIGGASLGLWAVIGKAVALFML